MMIGKKIKEIWYKSFMINSDCICEMITIYMKLDNHKWFEINSSDGISQINLIDPKEVSFDNNSLNEFSYPVLKYKGILLKKLGKIEKIENYLWMGKHDESSGFLFSFDNGEKISIVESNDCITIKEGIEEVFQNRNYIPLNLENN